jgi:hypothetical protein
MRMPTSYAEHSGGVGIIFLGGLYGLHSKGVTASGVPLEFTQPAAVSLQGKGTWYGPPRPSLTNSVTSWSSGAVSISRQSAANRCIRFAIDNSAIAAGRKIEAGTVRRIKAEMSA